MPGQQTTGPGRSSEARFVPTPFAAGSSWRFARWLSRTFCLCCEAGRAALPSSQENPNVAQDVLQTFSTVQRTAQINI